MQIELLKFPYSYMEYEKILQTRELKVLLPEIEVLSETSITQSFLAKELTLTM